MYLLEVAICGKCRSSHFQSDWGITGGLLIWAGLLLLGGGVSTLLHAMIGVYQPFLFGFARYQSLLFVSLRLPVDFTRLHLPAVFTCLYLFTSCFYSFTCCFYLFTSRFYLFTSHFYSVCSTCLLAFSHFSA